MIKRIITIGLAAIMAFNMLACGIVATKKEGFEAFETVNTYGDNTFSDVKSGDWYEENVKRAYELGLFAGKENGRFDPQGEITIAEAITVADRLHKIYNTGNMSFEQSDPWYKCYFDYAEQNGIVEKGEFTAPNKSATRAQFARIIANALPESAFEKINDIKTGDIPDVAGNEYFASAVYTLYNAGIIVGNDDYGTYKPNDTIERCAVAAIATRMADRSLRIEKTLKPFEKNSYMTEIETDTFSIKVPMTDAMKDICTIEVSRPNRIDFYSAADYSTDYSKDYDKVWAFAIDAWEEDYYLDNLTEGYPIDPIGKLHMNDGRVLIVGMVFSLDVGWDMTSSFEMKYYSEVQRLQDYALSSLQGVNGTFVPDDKAVDSLNRKNGTWQDAYRSVLQSPTMYQNWANNYDFECTEIAYSIYDINKDGTPELFILNSMMLHTWWYIYTYDSEYKNIVFIDDVTCWPASVSYDNGDYLYGGYEIIGADEENSFYLYQASAFGNKYMNKCTLCNGQFESSFIYLNEYWNENTLSKNNFSKLKISPIFSTEDMSGLNWTGNNDSGNRHIADNLY